MKRLTIHYCPNDDELIKICDGKSEEYVRNLIEGSKRVNTVILTSQEIIINWVRVFICEGLINHDDVDFIFEDKIMFADTYGHLNYWPKGFCDYTDNILERLLKDMMRKSKE